MHEYTTWEQVAGYFDGDGSICFSDLSNQPFKLGISLIFTDGSKEQIQMLRGFLLAQGVKTSNVLRSTSNAWMLVISRADAVLCSLKKMFPHLYKKGIEAGATIDYLEGKITGMTWSRSSGARWKQVGESEESGGL